MNVSNVSELKSFISKHTDADFLYMSAHGYYDRRCNLSGLWIGDELWYVDDNNLRVPPVVILSACHTAPRGSGCVNPADLFLRCGAEAVLASSIPVNALRNSTIMTRLFIYVTEAMNGSKQYSNLLEAWTGITAGNAIHEIAECSAELKEWLNEKNKNGVLRMTDFQLNRVNHRMRMAYSYEDTIKIIKEMLQEEGIGNKYSNFLDHENYFPESFFYQFIGYPENIFLYSAAYEELTDKIGSENRFN